MLMKYSKLTCLEFTLEILPRPQGRPRVFGKFAVDPSKKDKESFLALAYQYKPTVPIDNPIAIELVFTMPRPKNHYNKKGLKPDAPMYHSSRPDIDNLEKLVMDALNGVFYRDDALVCRKESLKQYGETPSTLVRIWQVT